MNLTVELSSTRCASSASLSFPVAGSHAVVLTDAERQPCEVWTRVMGYHRPVSSFNIGKQAEHAERRFFETPSCGRR